MNTNPITLELNNYSLGDLLPAYGRDYKSARDAKESFLAGKDWTISSITSPYCGKYVNREDCINSGISEVMLRYDAKRKVCLCRIDEKLKPVTKREPKPKETKEPLRLMASVRIFENQPDIIKLKDNQTADIIARYQVGCFAFHKPLVVIKDSVIEDKTDTGFVLTHVPSGMKWLYIRKGSVKSFLDALSALYPYAVALIPKLGTSKFHKTKAKQFARCLDALRSVLAERSNEKLFGPFTKVRQELEEKFIKFGIHPEVSKEVSSL